MIKRKALIIGAPDEKIPGVERDVNNLINFLTSPQGGFWNDREIKTLISPYKNEISNVILEMIDADYSFVFFAGHGYYSIETKTTKIKINSDEYIDSTRLRIGAPKHTLILDCCRQLMSDTFVSKSLLEAKTLSSSQSRTLDPDNSRKYFDEAISKCDDGLVVMNSCSISETAGESASEGGYYTSSLINSANEWAKKTLQSINLQTHYSTHSTQECHNDAIPIVQKLSGGRQNPTFESPRSSFKFPFAVVA